MARTVKEIAEGPSPEQVRALVAFCDKAAWWLDDCLTVPGTGFHFGLDAIAGLIPFAGDVLAAGVSVLTIGRAARIGVPRSVLLRMGRNVAIDFVGGLIPGIGDAFDAVFKSHRRNFALLHKEYATMLAPIAARRRAPLWLRVAGALAIAAISYGLWRWLAS
ncbi:MAG: DUF4112 domain-containing protein [Nevskia sp.]|nr:DUF4112 domain-containing protein [Nevskia sp.]